MASPRRNSIIQPHLGFVFLQFIYHDAVTYLIIHFLKKQCFHFEKSGVATSIYWLNSTLYFYSYKDIINPGSILER